MGCFLQTGMAEHPSASTHETTASLCWREDPNGLLTIVDQWRCLLLVTLGENTRTMDGDEFWHHPSTLEDFGDKKKGFNELWTFGCTGAATFKCIMWACFFKWIHSIHLYNHTFIRAHAGGRVTVQPSSTMLRSSTASNVYKAQWWRMEQPDNDSNVEVDVSY